MSSKGELVMNKRLAIMPIVLVASLSLGATAFAGHGKGQEGKGSGTGTKGKLTMTVVTTDHGTCAQNPWATDTLKRTYTVKKNEDGSYRVRRKDKGTFLTTGPVSPGACETDSKHGKVLTAGYKGKVHGYLNGTVTGGTFNPNGTCTAQCTSVDFIAAFFTPGSQFTCNNGYAGCKFAYEYTSQKHNDQQPAPLLYHHWEDKGTNGVTEVFKGDIATG
jgi:hypothetical protein